MRHTLGTLKLRFKRTDRGVSMVISTDYRGKRLLLIFIICTSLNPKRGMTPRNHFKEC